MKKYLISIFVLVTILVVPMFVLGASADESKITETITNITDWIVRVALVLATLMYVIGGFLWLSDAGSSERVKMAKSIITSTTIGLIIILLAKALVSIVQGLVK